MMSGLLDAPAKSAASAMEEWRSSRRLGLDTAAKVVSFAGAMPRDASPVHAGANMHISTPSGRRTRKGRRRRRGSATGVPTEDGQRVESMVADRLPFEHSHALQLEGYRFNLPSPDVRGRHGRRGSKTGMSGKPSGHQPKIRVFVLPQAFVKLFSTPVHKLRVREANAMPRSVLVRTIHQIYRDKIEADTVDDAHGTPRSPMQVYVYDWFLNKYGLRKLAEKHVMKFLNGLILFNDASITVYNCTKFTLDVTEEAAAALDVYLDMLATMMALPVAGGLGHGSKDQGIRALQEKHSEECIWVRPCRCRCVKCTRAHRANLWLLARLH